MTVSASGHSYLPVLSENGRYVVFLSSAKNFVTNDNFAPFVDVFRHDLVTGQTKLISAGANADSSAPSVSSNGRWIAFASAANNLLPSPDTNSEADIFLADAVSLARSLTSVAADGTIAINPFPRRNLALSSKPQISAEGRWVAFESFATNLVAEGDTNNEPDVFLRDNLNNRTVLVSAALDGGMSGNGKSELVSMTSDGNYILFVSTATNLEQNNPRYRFEELYLRDVTANRTTWVRHNDLTPYACRFAVLSRDGRYVLYKTDRLGGTPVRINLYDRQEDTNVVVTSSGSLGFPINMSSDARFIVYDQVNGIFLWDRHTGSRTLVSGSSATNFSHSPVVSDDGSIVAFINAVTNMPAQIYYRNTVTSQLRSLTETRAGGPSGKDHYSSSVTVDSAGEFILFDSAEDDLVSDDGNRASDIFMHNIVTGETRLLSRAHPSSPSLTPSGKTWITNFCVSGDGNRILFFSSDSNLVPGDANGWPDAFVYDVSSHASYPLTTNASGGFGRTNFAVHGLLSANGRFALLGLLSPASSGEFANAPVTILRKDLETGDTIKLLSNTPPSDNSFPPLVSQFAFSMSADGRWVAYPSNRVIVVADLEAGVQTNLTSSGSWGDPLISPDGRYVTYVKTSVNTLELTLTDMQTGQRTILSSNYLRGAVFSYDSKSIVYGARVGSASGVYLYSSVTGSNAVVCTNCAHPATSTDARLVVYVKAFSASAQIEIKDMLTGRTNAVTGRIDTPGILRPVISGDGRFVVYTTKATNLTANVPNGWNNLYVYDRLQGTTIRVTGISDNAGYGSGSVSRPVLGPDGRTLVFQSFASDFVANDFNETRDLFLLKLGEHDVDNDVMSDSWEQTYFGTTNRDGTGDFDQDGQSDLAEYLSGTNPANDQSVFEVLTITSVGSGQRQLIWRAEPGKSYRVEAKFNLQAGTWSPLGQVITATGPTASAIDTTATPERRFYRVVLVQ